MSTINSPAWARSQNLPSLNNWRMFHSSTRTMVGMVSASQIREKLAAFLGGQIDLDSFEDWFVEKTWNIHQSGSVAAESLTFAIEESLSEHSSNHLTENDLRRELLGLLVAENITVNVLDPPRMEIVFKSTAPLIWVPVEV